MFKATNQTAMHMLFWLLFHPKLKGNGLKSLNDTSEYNDAAKNKDHYCLCELPGSGAMSGLIAGSSVQPSGFFREDSTLMLLSK